MVGRPRLERGTNGLKVRCSTNWANDPSRFDGAYCSKISNERKRKIAKLLMFDYKYNNFAWFYAKNYQNFSLEAILVLLDIAVNFSIHIAIGIAIGQ